MDRDRATKYSSTLGTRVMEDAPEGAEPKAETSDPEKLRAEEKEKRQVKGLEWTV